MQNLVLFYKYILRNQFLLKYPVNQVKNLWIFILKKIVFEVNLDNVKNNYYIYLYNIAILLRIILNKFLFITKINKHYNLTKIYMGINLTGDHMFQFLDLFTLILLPLFESFNIVLDLNKFDIFGNIEYQLVYCDPVFMSKNTVTVWSPLYSVNIKFCFYNKNKMLNYNILQHFKFKWYNNK